MGVMRELDSPRLTNLGEQEKTKLNYVFYSLCYHILYTTHLLTSYNSRGNCGGYEYQDRRGFKAIVDAHTTSLCVKKKTALFFFISIVLCPCFH